MKKIGSVIAIFVIVSVAALAGCTASPIETETDSPLPIVGDTVENDDRTATSEPEKSEEPEGEREEEETPEPNTATYIQSERSGLNVRSAASSTSTSLGTLDKGDRTLYLGTEGNWYKTYYRGKTAYVYSQYVSLTEMEKGSETVENVILIGEKYLGTPYVYGAVRLHYGNGIVNKNFVDTKFDCSSYTQYMFFYGAGLKLGTTTREQVLQGTRVEKADIQRGDLLFFTNSSRYYNTGIERVGHVALYLGDNYILHTASDHAVIEKISATRWSYYIETRRMV